MYNLIVIIQEELIGLVQLPDALANTLVAVIKDMLRRCNLPLVMCGGQAYNGATNMQGLRIEPTDQMNRPDEGPHPQLLLNVISILTTKIGAGDYLSQSPHVPYMLILSTVLGLLPLKKPLENKFIFTSQPLTNH